MPAPSSATVDPGSDDGGVTMSLLALIGLAVLAGLLGAGVAGVTLTVFLHRGITHGSHRMKPSVYAAGRWFTYLTIYMRHWEWRRVHRKHHLYTDTWIDEIRHDPHSPIVISEREGINGYRRVSWHMAAIFHAEAKLPDIRDSTYDIPQLDRPLDALDRRILDHPVRELACAVAGIAALGVHIWVLLRFGGVINSDCHRGKVWVDGAGYAINVKLLSFLIFGEGEHQTHHLYPQFARISTRWDLGWRVIAVLRWLGLTEVVVDRETVLAARRQLSQSRAGQTP
jgi:stearoyl-CoA desaturase (delta-9 desaturase)